MKLIFSLIVFIALCNACKINSPAAPAVEVEQAADIQTGSNQDQPGPTNEPDTYKCEIEELFTTIELPLQIDYQFLWGFDKRSDKKIIPYQCIGNGQVEESMGMPVTFDYTYGKFMLNDSEERYLVITGLNPENPIDAFYISANVYTMKNGKLTDEVMISKYRAYSHIQEENYGTIDESGKVTQHYTHTVWYNQDTEQENITLRRDTTFYIQ